MDDFKSIYYLGDSVKDLNTGLVGFIAVKGVSSLYYISRNDGKYFLSDADFSIHSKMLLIETKHIFLKFKFTSRNILI